MSIFLGICETIKINGVTDEAIRLRLFQFSLKDKARAWLFSLPANSIQTWDQLLNVFIAKYFPPSKTSRFRNLITNFEQRDGETLCEAWDRYKDMLRCCPHHGLERWLIVQTFYNGLNPTDRLSIDASAGGAIMNKEPDEAYNLIEEIAINQHYWIPERKKPSPTPGMHRVDDISMLSAKIDALQMALNKQTKQRTVASVNAATTCGN